MKPQKAFLFCIAIMIFLGTSAQDNYHAVHWDTDNGLSEDIIGCMLKDENGFLWISTSNGISRFDGSTFKNYFSGHSNKKNIIDNDTKKLIEDSLHNIWIGTTKGMSRFDIKADTFTHFLPNSDFADGSVLPFSATRDNVYCIEGFSLITTYDIHTLRKKILMKLTPEDIVESGMAILYTIFNPSTNSVWMLKGSSDLPGGGLYQISLSDGKREHYKWPCYKNIPAHSHWSEAMCYDSKRNCIWINGPDGLMEFTFSDKQFHHIGALNEFVNLKNYCRWVGIDLDVHGRIWLATYPKGIIIYDPYKKSVTLPFPKDSILQNEVSAPNLSIYCDRDDIVWSGFWMKKGLYQLNPFTPAVKRYTAAPGKADSLSNNKVLHCINTDAGQMWMGTKDGLNIFDPLTEKFEVLREKDLHIKKGEFMLPFAVNRVAKKAWLLTDILYEINLSTRNCRPVIYKDSAGNKLKQLRFPYGIPYKNGCFVQGKCGNQIVILILNANSIVAHQILAFPEGEIAMFNVVTDDHFLFLLNEKTKTTITYVQKNDKWIRVTNPLDTVERTKFFYDPQNKTYWLTINRQLLHYNRYFQFLNKYQLSEDLPGYKIISLIPDKQDNIWFNTDRGIFRLSPKTGKIIMLTARDGFKKQDFNSPIASVANDIYGNLYFPCGTFGEGFDRVSPDNFRETYPPSSVYLLTVEVNQNVFPLSTEVNNPQQLLLTYFQNNISIETGIIDYYSKGTSRIRYRLEGLNNVWRYAPANYTIRYDGLPPGKYKLVMQASNAADEFNGPMKSMLIQISPPFWKTGWFISLVVLIIVIAVNALFQFRLKQKMQVLNVRQKLHRDLHDDVGATLSSVKIYSEILQTDLNNPLITELIKNNASDMIDKLEVIAWATNPQHDTFKSFKELINKYAAPVCYAKNIDLNIQCDGVNDNMMMPGDIRQNLFLIFKEAINNTIKYSEASQCNVQTFIRDHKFYFEIKDNGNGFSGTIKGNGTGWKNMQKRVRELNGKIIIASEQSKGTSINITLHYPFRNTKFMV